MSRGVSVPRDEQGRKWCSTCQTYKDPAEFGRLRRYPDGLDYKCRHCANAQMKAARERDPERFKEYERRYAQKPEVQAARRERKRRYRAANAEQARQRQRRQNLRRYQITPEEFDEMAAAQGGLCAICRGEPLGRAPRLHVDHDHATGRRRGLICHRCNFMLGYAKENPATLLAAIDYLRSWAEVPA